MNTFEDILLPINNPKIKSKLASILDWVQNTYPNLEPVVKWNQPMFIHEGTFIIGFSVAKGHINIAPEDVTLKKFESQIKKLGYHQTKMLIQIKENQEIEYLLLKEMIDFNLEDKKGLKRFWR
jgi:uncharacterized protein